MSALNCPMVHVREMIDPTDVEDANTSDQEESDMSRW